MKRTLRAQSSASPAGSLAATAKQWTPQWTGIASLASNDGELLEALRLQAAQKEEEKEFEWWPRKMMRVSAVIFYMEFRNVNHLSRYARLQPGRDAMRLWFLLQHLGRFAIAGIIGDPVYQRAQRVGAG